MKRYPQPRYIDEDNLIECLVVERDGEAFAITSASVTFFDEAKTNVLTRDDGDADFTIDGHTLQYQLEVVAPTFSAQWYWVAWEYVSAGRTFIDMMLLEIKEAP